MTTQPWRRLDQAVWVPLSVAPAHGLKAGSAVPEALRQERLVTLLIINKESS